MLIVICALVIIFALAITVELNNDEARTIYKKILVLASAISMYMLSLYVGLKLILLPYIKKNAEQKEETPCLS